MSLTPREGATLRQLDDADTVPVGVRAAAGWAWRMLVVGVAVYYLLRLLSLFEVLVVPVLVAVLVVAFLKPFVDLVSAGRGTARWRTHRSPICATIASVTREPFAPLVKMTRPEPRSRLNWPNERNPELCAPECWTMSPEAVTSTRQPSAR